MASNKNKNQPSATQQQQQTGYGANPGQSGNDPKGQSQNAIQYQQQRYESQQGPLADAMAYNYGRGSEADFGNYTNMMNQYNDIASSGGGGSGGSSGGGGGGGGYSAFLVNPERVNAQQASAERANTERATTRALGPLERVQAQQLNPLQRVQAQKLNPLQQVNAQKLGPLERVQASDPYNSYAGMQEFSQTGGYSPRDIADMRARGISPLRAAYANAERNVGQQRALQGGYSPNAIAAQVKMAREQGQSMADASQNVDAGIAQARNQGRLAGLSGMGNIEQARQQAQMQGDIFNAQQANQGQQFDISNALQAGQFNANQGLQANQFDVGNQLQGDIYNSGQALQANQFDIGNAYDAAKYNANQAFQGQQFDIGNENQTSQFNAGQGNNMNQFNAGQANQTSQFNAGQGNQVGMFNADLNYKGQTYNADAQTQAQARNAAAGQAAAAQAAYNNQQQVENRLAALGGMRSLYGTNPAMSSTFGDQAAGIVGQGGNFGLGLLGAQNQGQQLPGAYDQAAGRVTDALNLFGRGTDIISGGLNNRNPQQPQQPGPVYGPPSPPVNQNNPGYSIPINQGFDPRQFGYQYDPFGGG